MKGKAMIMMICQLAYLAGWTAVPRMMQAPPVAATHCCAKMNKGMEHKCPKEAKGEKGCTDCCLSCPICFTMIPAVAGQAEQPSKIVSLSYGYLPVTYLPGYYADVWRPPNAA